MQKILDKIMINKAIELIESNRKEADFCGPAKISAINNATSMLGIPLPISYKVFLEKYGCGDIWGIEIFGIISDPKTDPNGIPNGIWLTKELRENAALPHHYWVISETGYGPYYVLNTKEIDQSGEAPVYLWHGGATPEKEAGSFGEFLFKTLKAVEPS